MAVIFPSGLTWKELFKVSSLRRFQKEDDAHEEAEWAASTKNVLPETFHLVFSQPAMEGFPQCGACAVANVKTIIKLRKAWF